MAPDLGKIFDLPVDTVMDLDRAECGFRHPGLCAEAGLPEDPVCGTAHRILTPYWAAQTGRHTLVSHQLSERGGELFCELHDDVVTISGRATPFLTGSIDLPWRA